MFTGTFGGQTGTWHLESDDEWHLQESGRGARPSGGPGSATGSLDDAETSDWKHNGWGGYGQRNHYQKDSGYKFINKDPPPEYDGKNPERTWRQYKQDLELWMKTTDIPKKHQGVKLRDALVGTARHSIEWWPIDWFIHEKNSRSDILSSL